MPRVIIAAVLALELVSLVVQPQVQAQQVAAPYYPPPSQWATRTPAQAGFDATALAEAIQFSTANENQTFRDLLLYQAVTYGSREPFNSPIGPTTVRGPVSGMIVRNGYLVAEWGEPSRVDMTFSVTKTFLTTMVGTGVAEGSHPRRQRSGARLHAARRRSLRRTAQPDDYLGPPAPADERLAGHAVGQARLGGSARG